MKMFQTLIHKLDAPVVLTGAALRSAAAVRTARQPRPLHTDHGGGGGFTAPPTPTPSLSSVKSSLEQPRPTRHHHFHTSALLAGPAGNRAGKESLEFHNVETAFAGVPTYNLVRAACVFTVCKWTWVVDNADEILDKLRMVFGDTMVSLVVRPTFFNHFCAGEDETSIVPTINYLQSNGIGAILDYAAEADVIEEDGGSGNDGDSGPGGSVVPSSVSATLPTPPPPPASSSAPSSPSPHSSSSTTTTAITASTVTSSSSSRSERRGSDRLGVNSARVYDYTTELQCDENAKIFENAIRAVHNVTPTGFAAIKVTALGNPVLLERWSTVLSEIRISFKAFDQDDDGQVTFDEFCNASRKLFRSEMTSDNQLQAQFGKLDKDNTGQVDVAEWVTAFEPRHTAMIADRWREQDTPLAQLAFTAEEVELVEATIERAENLIRLADELDVQVMVDAEHSYFQPAIDNIVLHLQRTFNRGKKATVYNTFQCYLTETPTKLAEHIVRSEREGWNFACKVVRGAYMVLERERAERLGYADPIQPTLEATHACFNAAVETVVERKEVHGKRGQPINLLVASHNQESIELAVMLMKKNGIDRATGAVAFGQLLGMSDHLSFTLGNAGYQAYKYVPYGPEHEVLPYLVRRAQENSSMLSGAGVERRLILSELSRRWNFAKGNVQPT